MPKRRPSFRAADEVHGCPICAPPHAGASVRSGRENPTRRSPIFERYLTTPRARSHGRRQYFLPAIHKRLGELYEAKGQRDKALAHYRMFIDLWKDADPELQPKVTDAKQRVAALTRGTDVRR